MTTVTKTPEINPQLFTGLRTELVGNVWPVIPSAAAGTQLAMQAQLDYTQWLDEPSMRELQFAQIGMLISHARKSVPYYRRVFEGFPDTAVTRLTHADWKNIPLLLRTDVQRSGMQMVAESLPAKEHGPLSKVQTSGSTGMPIVAYGTAVTRLFWNVFSLRDNLWHKRDVTKKIVSIRPEIGIDKQSVEFDNWGKTLETIYRTGKSAVMNSSSSIQEQAEWLMAQNAAYCLSLPTNIKALARFFAEHRLQLPGLVEMRTYGEVADDEVYTLVKQVWNVPVHDIYSSQETGYIALQCHEYGRHHIQSENLLVEILDEQGNDCAAGETGKVVVTTLHNYGMPLIRYFIGDYAVAGGPCPCGRGLPVIDRILGRERNMVTLPGGRRHYPSFPAEVWAHIAPIRQMQLVQKSLEQIEARLAMDREMTGEEKAAFTRVIQARMKHPFNITFSFHDRIERSKGGKFEDFISEVKSG